MAERGINYRKTYSGPFKLQALLHEEVAYLMKSIAEKYNILLQKETWISPQQTKCSSKVIKEK